VDRDLEVLILAEAFADLEDFPSALELCEWVLSYWPDSAAARNLKGFCLANLNRIPEALVEFREAKRLVPIYAPIRYNLAKALDDLGQAHAAIEEYGEALALDPNHPASRLGRGSLLMRQGQLGPALEDLQQAVLLAPHNAEAYLLRGACQFLLGRDEAARFDFRRAVELDPGERDRVEEILAMRVDPGGCSAG
jgi:Flp pilus assembly protein TadD